MPHRFVGQKVRVRCGRKLIEVFADGEPITAHPTQTGTGNVVTNEEHYPEGKRGLQSFHVQAALTEDESLSRQCEKIQIANVISKSVAFRQGHSMGLSVQPNRFGFTFSNCWCTGAPVRRPASTPPFFSSGVSIVAIAPTQHPTGSIQKVQV